MPENITKPTIHCYRCKNQLELSAESKILRTEECSFCSANIHCCKMCKFYDITAYNECREPSAERIVDKEKANFCDYFILNHKGDNGNQTKDDLLSAANSLFKS